VIKSMKKCLIYCLLFCSILIFTACGETESKVILTTGFGTNEVFKVGSEKASSTELMLFLVNTANQYEQVYGEEIWDIQVKEDTTMFQNLKEVALAQLSQVKAMKLLATEHQVALTEEEKAAADTAATIYLASLTDLEKETLGITDGSVVKQLYEEKLLADKLYAYLIRDVNPEISDDEARIITVQHILLKTYTIDEHGNKVEMTESERNLLREKAEEIHTLATKGESFDTLISKYSEDSKGTYSFGTGDMEETFENAAFALSTEEISSVVQTEQGYHIIKCISTLDREQTDLNKEKLLISRKQEVFGDTYNTFVAGLEKRPNSELILSLKLPDSSVVDTAEFFAVYEEELGSMFE